MPGKEQPEIRSADSLWHDWNDCRHPHLDDRRGLVHLATLFAS